MVDFAIVGSIAAVAAAMAIFITIVLGVFYLRRQRMMAPSLDPKAEPVPMPPNELEVSAPSVINTQPEVDPEPSYEEIKGPSDEEALSLSTMPDLPTTPMKVYVRVFVSSFRSCLFILLLGLLESEQCGHVARAPRRSVYEGRLFPGNFGTAPRYRKHPDAGQHASLVTLVAART